MTDVSSLPGCISATCFLQDVRGHCQGTCALRVKDDFQEPAAPRLIVIDLVPIVCIAGVAAGATISWLWRRGR